jgi:protoheme IX farnesyltransferase
MEIPTRPVRDDVDLSRTERTPTGHDPEMDRPLLLDLWDLTKPEISFLVTISALAGFLLGSPTEIDGELLCMTLLGTALTAGGVGVLNHYLERHLDARMRRTADRPLPTGRVAPGVALTLGLALTAGGVALLLTQTNLLTTGLAALTVGLYLFVYTPLKQHTPWNTIIGTIPGALPALGGWTAASGTLGWGGAVIFAILACWQMPHFLSLAWMYRKDYARAGYAMLPVVEPDGRSTAWQMLAFTALLSLAAITLGLLDVTGWSYLPGALVLNVWFFVPVYAFFRSRTARDARRVLMASILYIPLLLVLIFVDRLVQ